MTAVVAGADLSRVLIRYSRLGALANISEVRMTVNRETEAEVLRLFYAEKWRVGTIASQLGMTGGGRSQRRAVR